MEELKSVLSLKDFVDASNKLFDELSINERNALIAFSKKNTQKKNRRTYSATGFSFHVFFNKTNFKNSHQLAKNQRFYQIKNQ